jgi:hypothetical protein
MICIIRIVLYTSPFFSPKNNPQALETGGFFARGKPDTPVTHIKKRHGIFRAA